MGTFVQLAFGPYGRAAVGIIFYEARTVNAGHAKVNAGAAVRVPLLASVILSKESNRRTAVVAPRRSRRRL